VIDRPSVINPWILHLTTATDLRLQDRLAEEAGLLGLLILVLVVDTLGELARIGSVADGAVLPLLVALELVAEVEGIVDVGETELDVRVLGDLG
jgi:hypothetical protein